MVLLTVLTFGLYALYWTASFQSDLKKKTGLGFSGVVHILLIFITFGIYFLYWQYAAGERILKLGGPNHGLLYLILSLIGFALITPLLMQNEVNKL